MLILLSPYMCLRDIAKDHFSFFGYMLKNRFNNIDRIQSVHFPVFIIHGVKDKVIKVHHSFKLFESIKHEDKVLVNPPLMTHNNFDIYVDFIEPLIKFVSKINYQILNSEKQISYGKEKTMFFSELFMFKKDKRAGEYPRIGSLDKFKYSSK